MLIIKDNDFEIMYNRTVIGEAIRVIKEIDYEERYDGTNGWFVAKSLRSMQCPI